MVNLKRSKKQRQVLGSITYSNNQLQKQPNLNLKEFSLRPTSSRVKLQDLSVPLSHCSAMSTNCSNVLSTQNGQGCSHEESGVERAGADHGNDCGCDNLIRSAGTNATMKEEQSEIKIIAKKLKDKKVPSKRTVR